MMIVFGFKLLKIQRDPGSIVVRKENEPSIVFNVELYGNLLRVEELSIFYESFI
jgi:hypothetical protein